VVGIDMVSTARSAKRAGHRVYAADYFGDVDLRSVCSGCRAIIEQKRGKSCGRMASRFRPKAFLEMAESLLEKCEVDAILLCSGLDDDFPVLYELNDLVPILGNHPKVIERVRKKPGFFEELKHLGIAHPDTAIVKNIDEAKSAALEIGYPVMVKPLKGFGGVGIRPARDYKEIERAFFEVSLISKDVLVQKSVDGIHASVSFLASEKGAKVLTINEQLLGLSLLFQPEPFGYCGNIVPLHFSDSIIKKCNCIVEKIALHFGLKGSNGIDLVISEEGSPYVVEVNPRFQGTLECVERVLGINLVESHINACLYDSLPIIKGQTSTFCTRLILYAHKRVSAPDLATFQEARDIPFRETIIEKGEPLCSVVTEGKTKNASFQKAKRSAKSIYGVVHPA
jgi:predicted ATP-grasp superfamily ATP-dependent carboligase